MLLLFFCLLSLTAAATEVGLGGKVLLFPTKTSFVKLTPERPLNLSAFTLCMRVTMEPQTHLCVTWDSATGLSAFWVDGRRSAFQIYKKDKSVLPGGTVLLGLDPDEYVGSFNSRQSFVGEITDVNMWDYVLSGSQIKALHLNQEQNIPKGNVFDWNTIKYETNGNVLVVENN
ncbi:pentraxin fusion protein-like isoform X2 [Pimephales promelas]|nr:pentraxin fusion protein-like isoform X2 [Pimephales promelas]